jgi:hypothetical protein
MDDIPLITHFRIPCFFERCRLNIVDGRYTRNNLRLRWCLRWSLSRLIRLLIRIGLARFIRLSTRSCNILCYVFRSSSICSISVGCVRSTSHICSVRLIGLISLIRLVWLISNWGYWWTICWHVILILISLLICYLSLNLLRLLAFRRCRLITWIRSIRIITSIIFFFVSNSLSRRFLKYTKSHEVYHFPYDRAYKPCFFTCFRLNFQKFIFLRMLFGNMVNFLLYILTNLLSSVYHCIQLLHLLLYWI